MKNFIYTMLFGLVVGLVIFIFRSEIIFDITKGYKIVQQINKGYIKTIPAIKYRDSN